MSILIDPTSGGLGSAGQQSTLTESPEGPDAIWSGLRFQCPVWKTKDLGTTGGGTVYTVGEAYVTGYIVPKLCGVAQGPTRFTETDTSLGTFTFDVAPDSGWPIHVDYGVYCDEGLGLHIPSLQGKGLPAKATLTGGIGRGSGGGSRAYVAGRRADTGAPIFVWTENIYAASPTWTANITGLPAAIGTQAIGNATYFRLDPWAPSTTGYMCVPNTGESSSNTIEVYKNTAMRTGGTWTKIFDYTTHNTATGESATGIEEIDLALSIVQPNFLVMVAEQRGGTSNLDTYLLHSHDGGTTWSGVFMANIFGAGCAVLAGHHDATIVYGSNSPVGGGAYGIWRSTDHGHTVSLREQIDLRDGLVLPYNANASDAILFTVASALGLNSPARSTDGADTWTVIADGTNYTWTRMAIHSADFTDVAIALGGQFGNTSTGLSNDGGNNWTQTANPTSALGTGLAMLRPGIYFYVSTGTNTKIFTSSDWITFTDRTGNFATAVGSTIANAVPQDIVPDWTSA